MRIAATLLVLLLAACGRPEPTLPRATPSPEAGILDVTVLLDLSSTRGTRGDAQRNAVQLWSDLDRSRGGGQVRVRTKIVDTGGSDARLLIELRRAAEEDRADAVIVGVPVDPSGFAPAAAVAALPTLLTLPTVEPVAQPRGGRWMFALAPTPEQLARRVADARAGPVAVLARDDRALDPEAAAVVQRYRTRGIEPVLVRPDPKRDDQIEAAVRFVAAAQRVHVAGPPRDWMWLAPQLARGARLASFVLSYATDSGDLGELRDLDAVWPAPLYTGAQRTAFQRAYADRHGVPTGPAASAYDALSALVIAAERVGPDDRERLREQLEITAFTGVGSSYSFAVTRHAGGGGDDLALYRWSAGAVVPDPRR